MDINEKNNGNDICVGSIENSIEENIERIAKLITTKFNNDYSIDNVDKEAIEELLKAYKELKEIEESHRKENGKLRERVKELEEWNEYYRKEMLSKEYIKLNYIPKSKVEEKIEEIQKEYEETLKTANFKEIEKMNKINFRGITLEGQRSILRELLEKRK